VTPGPVRPGRPAGVVTRTLAATIDLVVVVLMGAGLILAIAGLRFAVSPATFQWPSWTLALAMPIATVLAAAYLTIAWATTGRTYGAAVLGLRVRAAGGGRLGWVRAGLRAVLYLIFPVGLLWVVVSPRRRSVQDVILRSVVRYDWRDDAGLRELPGPAESLVVESPIPDGDPRRVRGQPSPAFDDDERNPR
jgi:uncharacterized RDD family membrane protein YckC